MEHLKFTRNWARAAMLLLTMLLSLTGARADVVTIGDGTVTQYYVPIGTYYNYSITEQLYTADEIEMAGTINSISFYYAGTAAKDFPITVYMKTVDAADLSTGISLDDAEEVFSGTFSVTEAGWATIDLDTPFAYDGKSNLLIGVIKDYVYWYSGNTWQGTATSSTMARYSQNDNSAYDTSTVPGTAQANRPNIQIDITPGGGGPVCEKPTEIAVDNITKNSATVTWEDDSGDLWNLQYRAASDEDWTEVTGLDRNSYELTDLLPNTTYSVRVQTDCGGGSTSGWKSTTFTTPVGLPFVEEFGTSIPTGWAQYAGLMDGVLDESAELTSSTYGWSFGTANGVFDNHARVNIYGTSCNKWLVTPTIPMENNVQLTFDVALTAYSGTGAAPAQGGTDDKFVVLAHIDKGWYVLRQWDNAGSEYVYNNLNATPTTVNIDLSEFAGENVTIAFYGESTEENADNNLHIDNVSVDYIPACPKPTGLAVNYESGVTATLTWEGNADAYNIDVNGTVIEGVTSPYELEDLELATVYEVKVQAACSATEQSEWTNPVSFTTDACMPEDMIVVNYELNDSYGDGWGGNYILIFDENCEMVDYVTLESGNSGSGTIKLCGSYAQFKWFMTSSNTYPEETSWTFTDADGNVLFSGAGNTSMNDYDVLYTIDQNPYPMPSDLLVSNVGPFSAELSWTDNGSAKEWEIGFFDGEGNISNIVTASSNPFTLTDLDAETTYAVTVRGKGSNGTSLWTCSSVIFSTTSVADAKFDVSVTPYPDKALVNWKGTADTFNLEWALAPTDVRPLSPSDSGLWLQYDDGTIVTNVGSNTSGTRIWGVKYPAEMFEGNNSLSKVAVYESQYYTMDSYTVSIYSGGDTEPGELLSTETVIPTGESGMHEITLEPITIDPTQNLWITVTATGTYVMAVCAVNNADNQWWGTSGEWSIMGEDNPNLADYGWMIRGYVEGYDPDAYEWNTITGISSPYTIDDLQPETTYIVKVQGDYGTNGLSGWTWKVFTTPSASEAPIEPTTSDITATTATLNWIGYQDNFNVQYRVAPHVEETFFFDDFEDGLDQWTIDGSGTPVSTNDLWYTIDPTNGLNFEAHGGTYAASSWSWNSSAYNADNWLITPQITFGNTLTFWVRTNASYPDHYEVLLSTGGNTINTYTSGGENVYDLVYESGDFTETLLEMDAAPAVSAWTEVTIDLSRYEGEQGYIAIHHVDYDANYLLIDDFGIYNYSEAGDWIPATSNEESLALTGLTPATEYEWQVQGILSNGTTEWTELATFTTMPSITLADADDNSQIIEENDALTADVTLSGRTLWRDGAWNTLTLPFNYDLTAEGNVLEGADVRALSSATLTGKKLKLNFTAEGEVTEIEAGVPYIIKWAATPTNIENPVFSNVTIDAAVNNKECDLGDGKSITFTGTYEKITFTPNDKSILFLGENNILYYPGEEAYLNAQRAYFQLDGDFTGVRFVLDFGEESGTTTGIVSVEQPKANGDWYDLNGRKLDNQPMRKGVYIRNGKKEVIK